jgi:hypothetical protein
MLCRNSSRFASTRLSVTTQILAATCLALGACGSSSGGGISPNTQPPGDAGGDSAMTVEGDDGGAEGGAACPTAPAAPLVASPVYQGASVRVLAVGPTNVYWCTFGNGGALWMEPLAGGTATQIAFSTMDGGANALPTVLVTDASSLWLSNSDGIQRAGLDGSNLQVVVPASALPIQMPAYQMVLDDDNVYVTGASNAFGSAAMFDTLVVSAPKAGGPVKTITTLTHASNYGHGSGFAVDATNVYWADYKDSAPYPGGIFAAPKAGGGTPTMLFTAVSSGADESSGAEFMQGSGDAFYMSTSAGLAIVHTSQPTIPPAVVDANGTLPIAVDGDTLYYTNISMPDAGSSPISTILQTCGVAPGVAVTSLPGESAQILRTSSTQLFIAADLLQASPGQPAGGGLWTISR